MTDIQNLSIEELKKLQDEAGALIVVKQEQEIIDAYDKVYAIADSVGLTLEDLLEEVPKET
jgi:DNA-binding protein H-NS